MNFAWQARYKRHLHQTCYINIYGRSGSRFPEKGWLHFGASDLQVCEDDSASQVQHFVKPGLTSSWQAQHFTQMQHEAVSATLDFPFLKEALQNCCVFDVIRFGILRKSRRISSFLML